VFVTSSGRVFATVESAEAALSEYEYTVARIRHLVRTPPGAEYEFVEHAASAPRAAAIARTEAEERARAQAAQVRFEAEADENATRQAALALPPPGTSKADASRGCVVRANFHNGFVNVFVTPHDTVDTVRARMDAAGAVVTPRCLTTVWLVSPSPAQALVHVKTPSKALMALGARAGWQLISTCGSAPPSLPFDN
jgi:multidrug resistance efflux pump